MVRPLFGCLLTLVVAAAPAPAATAPKAGNYELIVANGPTIEIVFAIVKITPKDDGSIACELVASGRGMPGAEVSDVALKGDILQFHLKAGNNKLTFEGKAPKAGGADKLLGSFGDDSRLSLARLVMTDRDSIDANGAVRRVTLPEPMQKAQQLASKSVMLRLQAQRTNDAEEKAKLLKDAAAAEKEATVELPKLYLEVVEKHADDPSAAAAAMNLLRSAGKDKVDGKTVAHWAALAAKAAEPYGPGFEIDTDCRIASALSSDPAFPRIAVEFAQRAEKLVSPEVSVGRQSRVLMTLARAQKKAGMADAAKQTLVRLGKIELVQAQKDEKALGPDAPPEKQETVLSALATAQRKTGLNDEATVTESRLAKIQKTSDQEYLAKMPPFKPGSYSGRKEKGDRVVVMELFTGAQCPPCIAADVGFDALEKTYKPTDVVFLQYHLHIPGPDPLTNPTTEARAKHYSVNSTPTTLFNGKKEASGGGTVAQSERKYKEYREIIDKLLEEPAKATVNVDARCKGDTIAIRAKVSNVSEPSDKLHLRLALVEESIRYVGGNKLRFHHMVVRSMPGGVEGFKVNGKEAEHTADVNIDSLREKLEDYLDDRAASNPFPKPDRPLALKNLKVIAFVQDDETGEILQAALSDLGSEHAAK